MPDDIKARLQRLRRAGRTRRRAPTRGPVAPKSKQPPPAQHDVADGELQCLTDLPGMELVEGRQGTYLLRTTRYPLTHSQGQVQLGDLLALPPEAISGLAQDVDIQQITFLDTETSGLAGGAGTIVFLTGVGFFDGNEYVVHQFFARNPGEEQAYLPDLARFISERQGLITFNGKSFDWPLLRSRFILNGLHPPDENPHLDLLHPARRLWKPRLGACNFGNLERRILSYQRRGQDIPSYMIPGMWFNFARGQGSAREMESVLYHNLEDVLSMAPLTHVIASTIAGMVEPHPHDWLALAQEWQRRGKTRAAEDAYLRALDGAVDLLQRSQIMEELALLLKRQNRRAEAAIWWQALTGMNTPRAVEAMIELAKYHEWHTGDLEEARAWTVAAIERVETWPNPYQRQSTLAELHHRLQRLQRKML